jgi:hypothetical protein
MSQNDRASVDDLLEGAPEARRAYISQIIAVAADDAKNVMTVATVALAIIVFFVKDSVGLVRQLAWPFRGAAAIAAVALFCGAALLFQYAALINYRRMGLARCLASDNAARAHDIWAGDTGGIRRQHGWILASGMITVFLGMLMAAVVTSALLL